MASKKKEAKPVVSKEFFVQSAEALELCVENKVIHMTPKEFSTGSFGWNASSKFKTDLNGTPVQVQFSANATVIGSKTAPTEATPVERGIIESSSGSSFRADTLEKIKLQDISGNEVLFFPDDQDRNIKRILSIINAATSSIDVCVFAFTDARLYSVLVEAFKRNVRVRVIVDDQMANMKSAKAAELSKQGVAVRMDSSPFHMHHKFAIVDAHVILTGSFNWTVQAQRSNRENLLITTDSSILLPFASEFEHLWAQYA